MSPDVASWNSMASGNWRKAHITVIFGLLSDYAERPGDESNTREGCLQSEVAAVVDACCDGGSWAFGNEYHLAGWPFRDARFSDELRFCAVGFDSLSGGDGNLPAIYCELV